MIQLLFVLSVITFDEALEFLLSWRNQFVANAMSLTEFVQEMRFGIIGMGIEPVGKFPAVVALEHLDPEWNFEQEFFHEGLGLQVAKHFEGPLEAPFAGVIHKGIHIDSCARLQGLSDVFDVDLSEDAGRFDSNLSRVFALGFPSDLLQELFSAEETLDSIAAEPYAMVVNQMSLNHFRSPVVAPSPPQDPLCEASTKRPGAAAANGLGLDSGDSGTGVALGISAE
jgi:hypothetical protein